MYGSFPIYSSIVWIQLLNNFSIKFNICCVHMRSFRDLYIALAMEGNSFYWAIDEPAPSPPYSTLLNAPMAESMVGEKPQFFVVLQSNRFLLAYFDLKSGIWS